MTRVQKLIETHLRSSLLLHSSLWTAQIARRQRKPISHLFRQRSNREKIHSRRRRKESASRMFPLCCKSSKNLSRTRAPHARRQQNWLDTTSISRSMTLMMTVLTVSNPSLRFHMILMSSLWNAEISGNQVFVVYYTDTAPRISHITNRTSTNTNNKQRDFGYMTLCVCAYAHIYIQCMAGPIVFYIWNDYRNRRNFIFLIWNKPSPHPKIRRPIYVHMKLEIGW